MSTNGVQRKIRAGGRRPLKNSASSRNKDNGLKSRVVAKVRLLRILETTLQTPRKSKKKKKRQY
jgi:hypothetical protein